MAARKRFKRNLDAEAEKKFREATAPPAPPPATKTTWTRQEIAEQEERVEAGLVRAASVNQIAETLRTEHGVGRRRTLQLIARIRERWSRETESTRAYTRDEQIRRVRLYIQRLQGRPKIVNGEMKGWDEPPNYHMLHKWESLLADLEGNKEPLKINVDVRYTEAMLSVMAGVTGEDLLRLAQEQREIEAKARAFDEGIVVRQLPMKKAG